jgi:multidrug efflux pump subunit AcrB
MNRSDAVDQTRRPKLLRFGMRTLLLLIGVVALVLALARAAYEWANRQPTALVVFAWPGASPEDFQQEIGQKLDQGFWHHDSWTFVAYADRAELYVVARPGTDSGQLQRNLVWHIERGFRTVPAAVSVQPPELLGNEPIRPEVKIKQEEHLEVLISANKLGQHGGSLVEIHPQLVQIRDTALQTSGVSRESQSALKKALLKLPNNKQVRLGDIAEVNVVRKPNAVVRESR